MGILEEKAKQLRRQVLELGMKTGEAHLGGSFSEIEILTVLYNKILNDDDKFILSKGHSCYPLYLLLKERCKNPEICAHPNMDIQNGISCTTGSLGHGLPIGIGMALARKKLGNSGRVYVLMGDGECQEGTIWESALIANHHKLENLTAIVDHNKLQALDRIENILSLGSLAEKFRAFGWSVIEVDGHNIPELIEAFEKKSNDKPTIIIAHTIKGKGVSYTENDPKWHTRLPNQEELLQAYKELE